MRFFLTASLFVAGAAFAQSPAPVVGVGNFIHVVSNLDNTMRFYGDRLGLERTGAPGPRAFSVNAVVENLYNAKGAQSRVAVYKIPDSPLGLEFAELKGASQTPFHPRIQDPGAALLTLHVADLDAVMTKLKEDATPVVSDGGKNRTVVVKDPDGFFIQLTQGAPGAGLSLTVEDTDRTLHVFRDLLGFQPETGKSFLKDKEKLRMLGLHKASYRSSVAKVPGTNMDVEFIEFKGIDRHPASAGPDVHDPGIGVLRLVVRDVDGLFQSLKTAGVVPASARGEIVAIGARHFIIMRDPDNFFFQLFPQPAPAAR